MSRPAKRPKLRDNPEGDNAPGPFDHSGSDHDPKHTLDFDGGGIQNAGEINVGNNIIITYNDRVASKRKAEDDRERLGREQQEEHRQTILKTLQFDQMDARQLSIKTAHSKTCKWFLQDKAYREWLKINTSRDTGKFLWIKGKPGAGKSTMMKFLFKQARGKKNGMKVISFFFNARGGNMEKSTLGLYQSLVVQLFEQYPQLMSVLDIYRNGIEWNVESVKELFEETVKALGKTPVICFIDALDECGEQQIRDMIAHLSGICDDGNPLHICFASRHYPHITIRKGSSIVLENMEEHQQDIANYIDNTLYIGKENSLEGIRFDLQKKASGVFMWVVLVVDILNKECDAGRRREFQLRRRLAEIPGDLHSLFRDILTRDTNNKPTLLLCIQWVLFAQEPLTPKQLYFAIVSGNEPENLAGFHAEEVADDEIAKFLLDSSKGLAESTKSKLPTIQFIHESSSSPDTQSLLGGSSYDP
ncbi:hypothetical protein MCOR16_009696 [Pyricularia oryzae]|nr:hypothetical protein MCOR15_010983 [Pyricularia oryzae]KAI6516765.1 hypothetical protein MCOR16_009696 [Pyricularia oryzae]